MHWKLADEINDLAGEHHVAWNRMAVTLIELGIPVERKLKMESPAFLQDLLHERHKLLSEKERLRVDRIAEKTSKHMKFDDRIAAALPSPMKQRIKRTARRRGTSMSRIVRQSLEVA